MALLFGLVLPVVIVARRKVEPQPIPVLSWRDESSQVPTYLISFIFPVAFAPSGGFEILIAYAFFGFLLFTLLARTDLCLVNPVLLAFGYRLFAGTDAVGRIVILVAKSAPVPGVAIKGHPIFTGAYLFDQEVRQ